jgi:hypothetical protein
MFRDRATGAGIAFAWVPTPLLQTRGNKAVEIAVHHTFHIPDFDIGAQVFHPALVEHLPANLVAPADVALARF